MKEFSIEIVTPSKTAYTGDVKSLTVPGTAGEFQVLFNHAPLMSTFEIGRIRITDASEKEFILITSGGVIEIQKNKILLLAQTVEKPEEIDLQRAEKSAERAKKRLSERTPDTDFTRAEAALARALNRMKYYRA